MDKEISDVNQSQKLFRTDIDLLEDRMMDVEMSASGAHTGGKGWCPDPVHHKYIARKWTKNLPNTHLEYSKDIQNFPSQFN